MIDHPDSLQTAIGACPDCGRSITEGNVLIRYQTAESTPGIWASCPDCNEVIDPIHDSA
jgi:hypothetical protein